ncbi:MAG: hypothetical protein ACK4GC_04680 [Paracoccaceae bacterium]
MANSDRTEPVATPPWKKDDKRDQMDEKITTPEMGGRDFRLSPARSDPGTGEVRAGPGDAGLADHPKINTQRSASKQMSNRRLAIGLAMAALLAVIVLTLKAVF